LSDAAREPLVKVTLPISDLIAYSTELRPETLLAPPLERSGRYRLSFPTYVPTGPFFVENCICHRRHHRAPARSGRSLAARLQL